MEITAQKNTYDSFIKISKWSSVAIVAILAIMAAALT